MDSDTAWFLTKVGIIVIVLGAGFYFLGIPILNAARDAEAPEPIQTIPLTAMVISAHNYTSGGGLLQGAQIHDIVAFKISNGVLFFQNFSCTYYNVGMNVSINKTIEYPNIYGNYGAGPQPVSTPITGTTEFQVNNYGNQVLATTVYTVVTSFNFTSEVVSYSIQGIPSGC